MDSVKKSNKLNHFSILITTVLVANVVLSLISCTQITTIEEEEEEPGTTELPLAEPSNGEPEEALADWNADGILGANEYLGEAQYGNYEIRWRTDEEFIYIGIRAKTNGWVSVGFEPSSRMANADMVVGFVQDGTASVSDQFSSGDFGPHPPDTDLGGTDDILEFDGMEDGGYTTIEFKRALDTGDEYDHQFAVGTNQIIWAYGSDDSISTKHSSRGYGEIDL